MNSGPPHRRVVSGLLLLGVVAMTGAPEAAADARRERIQRVQKGRISESLHIYWASWATSAAQGEVLVTPYLERTQIDAQFEIIDQKGYVGRARVHHVEMIQGGCPNVRFWNGLATLDGRRDVQEQSMMVALPVSRRDLSHARVIPPEDLHDVPRLDQRKFLDVGLDLDGNGVVDLVRYYYDCPSSGLGAPSGYCMDVYARERARDWKLLETVIVPECV